MNTMMILAMNVTPGMTFNGEVVTEVVTEPGFRTQVTTITTADGASRSFPAANFLRVV